MRPIDLNKMEAFQVALSAATCSPRSRKASEALAATSHDHHAQLIDLFLTAVSSIADRTPTDQDLALAKAYVRMLTEQTRSDHIKSVDETSAHVSVRCWLRT